MKGGGVGPRGPAPVPEPVERVEFKCDSFVGIFSVGIKPSAAIYNKQREDLECALKFGTSLHGEVFCNGVRLCRQDGAPHREALPSDRIPCKVGGMEETGRLWSLRDALPGEFEPTFPTLKVHFAVTDGSSCQVFLFCSFLIFLHRDIFLADNMIAL